MPTISPCTLNCYHQHQTNVTHTEAQTEGTDRSLQLIVQFCLFRDLLEKHLHATKMKPSETCSIKNPGIAENLINLRIGTKTSMIRSQAYCSCHVQFNPK